MTLLRALMRMLCQVVRPIKTATIPPTYLAISRSTWRRYVLSCEGRTLILLLRLLCSNPLKLMTI
jgi:hypothetical protein